MKTYSEDFLGVLRELNLQDAPRISFENKAYQDFVEEPDEDDLPLLEAFYKQNTKKFNELVQIAS